MSNLMTAAQALVPRGVALAQRDPKQLWPMTEMETRQIAKAVPRRRAEFSAGRDAARACLIQLGSADLTIGIENRAPIWPAGFTGSITHSAQLCFAAAARNSEIEAIGLDVEPDEPLPDELAPTILREDDQSDGRVAFSAKEAVYKMLSAQLLQMLEFHDLRLRPKTNSAYRVELMIDAGLWRAGDHFDVSILRKEKHILSLCWIEKGTGQ